MNVFEQSRLRNEEHDQLHRQGLTSTFRNTSCLVCYPITRAVPLPDNILRKFHNFWNWIRIYCYAETYTAYTLTAFNIFITIFPTEPISEGTGQRIISERLC